MPLQILWRGSSRRSRITVSRPASTSRLAAAAAERLAPTLTTPALLMPAPRGAAPASPRNRTPPDRRDPPPRCALNGDPALSLAPGRRRRRRVATGRASALSLDMYVV